MEVSLFSPAKINLYLAVTGRRADGFHDLVSVAAPLDFGDELQAESRGPGAESQFTLECDDPAVPVDGSNLVLKAAEAYAAMTGWRTPVHFRLTKRIPLGAGLGGGSSNAVAALRALNQLAGGRLDAAGLAELAGALGSDCPLFLADAPVVMRGRGERIAVLSETAAARLRGGRVLLFKPGFAISTAWAYSRLAAEPRHYVPVVEAERKLAVWLAGDAPLGELIGNNMEAVAFAKYPALPRLLEKLRHDFGVAAGMSGSGSTCFALLDRPPAHAGSESAADAVTQMTQLIHDCWGPAAFVQVARLV